MSYTKSSPNQTGIYSVRCLPHSAVDTGSLDLLLSMATEIAVTEVFVQ